MTSTLSIDITRLEKVRERGTKLQARCPACAADGADRRGEHFFANLERGAWGCAARPGDTEHRRSIFALIGVKGERPPETPEWREARRRERREAEERQRLVKTARERRASIVERWAWHPADLWESSPQRVDCDLVELDPRHFIATQFPQGAFLWTGEVFHSSTRHADRWRTVAEWQDSPEHTVGPMIAPAIWKPGTTNRTRENVLSAPFTVLDFDELDGKKPETAAEIEALQTAARGITRWLVEGMHWRLAAIIATGAKSLHVWFHAPGNAALQSLRTTAPALGIDGGLIGQPEHPARLPGQRHIKTGNLSRCLWLQAPRD